MEADIVCVGFGPAVAGFLTTLSGQLTQPDGSPRFESAAVPGLPPQVIAYERADDLSFGVSGVVTRAAVAAFWRSCATTARRLAAWSARAVSSMNSIRATKPSAV